MKRIGLSRNYFPEKTYDPQRYIDRLPKGIKLKIHLILIKMGLR